jgi:hypothetical protein
MRRIAKQLPDVTASATSARGAGSALPTAHELAPLDSSRNSVELVAMLLVVVPTSPPIAQRRPERCTRTWIMICMALAQQFPGMARLQRIWPAGAPAAPVIAARIPRSRARGACACAALRAQCALTTSRSTSSVEGDAVGEPVGARVGGRVGADVGPVGALVGALVGNADGVASAIARVIDWSALAARRDARRVDGRARASRRPADAPHAGTRWNGRLAA